MAAPTARPKRVVKSAHERRRELLDAALEVFRRRGASEATVEDITATAGVAKGTFYRYFDGKEDIVDALRGEVAAKLLSDVAARAGSDWQTADEWWHAVDVMVETFLDFLVDHEDEHRALWHSGPLRPGAAEDDTFAQLATLAATAAEQGIFAADDPHLTVIAMFGSIHALADHALGDRSIDRARLLAEAVRVAHRALAVDPP